MEELVGAAGSSLSLSRPAVAKKIHSLWSEGRLDLLDSSPPRSLSQYLRSWYGFQFWATFSIVLATILDVVLVPASAPYVYFRYAIGSVYVLYLPGANLIDLFYPASGNLTSLERLALAAGLSLTLVPLVGLVLAYTPWGVRLGSVMVSLSLLTLLTAFGAAARKSRLLMTPRSPHGADGPA